MGDWIVANGPSQRSLEAANAKLNELIIRQGFRVVNPTVLLELTKPAVFNEIKEGRYVAATKVLKDNGVDVMLIAKAFTTPAQSSVTEAHDCQAASVSRTV